MAEYSLPWGGTSTGDAGPYSAETWQTYQKLFMGFHASAPNNGVIDGNPAGRLRVSQASGGPNMSVDVEPGAALVDGIAYWSDAIKNLSIDPAHSTLNRYDLIVLRADVNAQTVRLAVKTGTPAATPIVPTLDQSRNPTYEIPVARVRVEAATTWIFNRDIEYYARSANTPDRVTMRVYNNSGADLQHGTVVAWHTTGDRHVYISPIAGDEATAGVVDGYIPNGEWGQIVVQGLADVLTGSGTFVPGQAVSQNGGRASFIPHGKAFARAVQPSSTPGLVRMFISPSADDGVPAGTIVPFAGSTAPGGWLFCHGQEVDRTTYARLFNRIGTAFGAGNGSTTFNLPDMRGRVPLGKDNMGGASANRVTNPQADVLGGSMGAETHTLSIAEMPSHSHVQTRGDEGAGQGTLHAAGTAAYQTVTATNVNTQSAGGGGAHNNMQPSITMNYIIRT